MKQCPNGHEVGDNVKFCPECGAEIKDNGTKFCAKCGNERKGTEKFCSQCGTPYGQSLTSNVSEIEVSQDKSSKKGILIVAVVAIIALLGGAAWYFLGNQNKYSLEGLAKAVVNYDYVGDFQDGMAIVNKGEKIGFIDKMGNEVIPCIYDFLEDADCSFREGLAFVRQGDKCFFIDKEGKKPFDFKYDSANNFSEGLAVVWKDGKCGYIDTKGNEVIALTDKQFYSDLSDGLAAVSKDGKFGFIDKTGKLVIPFNFEQLEPEENPSFHEGLAAVGKNGKYGYIDKNGKVIVPFKFDSAYDFSEGMAVVAQNDKWGFVDKNGNIVIPCEYESANSFSEGYAVVSKDKKYFFIDKNGNKVLPTISDNRIGSFHDGLASFNKYADGDMRVGYIDVSGKEVVPCVYSGYGHDFSEGLAVVKKDDIYGFVDKKGNSTFDIQNEEVKKIVQAKIQEKEEARKEEERKAEEERKRIEEERRRGVEKEITLSCTKGDGHSIMPQDRLSGNYGAYSASFLSVRSNAITVPNNKVWVFDRYEITEGQPHEIALFYFSRLSKSNRSDAKYELKSGDVPIIRGGDKIVISFDTWPYAGTYSIRVLFKEKDEDLYF